MPIYILNQGTASDPKALRLDTRRRRHIGNEPCPEKPIEGILEVARIIEKSYPGTRLISATAVYNCFGLAFASRRTWVMDAAEVIKALEDDDYRALPWDQRLWDVGDIVLYRTENDPLRHVSVIVEKRPLINDGGFEIYAVSAWGETGEYLHPLNPGHPMLGEPFEVRSQRVVRESYVST